MNNIKKRLFFRVDGDTGLQSGLGHLNRIIKIYYYLKKIYSKKVKFFFIIKKNTLGHRLIRDKLNEIVFDPKIFIKKIKLTKVDLVLVDTLGIDTELRLFLKKSKVEKIISFDDINIHLKKKLTLINGIFFTKKIIYKKRDNNIKIFQGLKYILLDSKFEKKKFVKNKNILITSGGTDSKNFLFKVSNLFLRELPEEFKFLVIIGRGVKKNNNIYKIKSSRIKLIHQPINLKNYFDKSFLTICSGGTVMFESVSSGKPTVTIKTYDNQKFAINYFSKKKLIFNGGSIERIYSKCIIKYFFKLIEGNNLKKIFKKNSKFVDGYGFRRIKKILKDNIN